MGRRGKKSHNINHLCRFELPGAGQIRIEDNYAYIGHIESPAGTTILDISNPRAPKIVSQITLPDRKSHTHKVRVMGDLMICNHEMHDRHFLRKGFDVPKLEARYQELKGRGPTDEELAAELSAPLNRIGELREVARTGYTDGGFKVYDISDKSTPKLITHQRTGGIGVHRFDVCDRYAYISTEMEGFQGNILVTYDLADPTNIQEVSRWWMPGQHIAGGEVPTWKNVDHKLHHALRRGDHMWAACWHGGLHIVDVKDITKPKTVGSYNYHPLYPEGTHTFMPIPHKIAGMDIALAADEEHPHANGKPHAFLWVFDVSDYSNIRPISQFHLTDFDAPWAHAHLDDDGHYGHHIYGPGLHQFAERTSPDNLVYSVWFSGGLRVLDISNPLQPEEVAFFLPEPAKGHVAPQSNDVDIDSRGVIYVMDREGDLNILELKGC